MSEENKEKKADAKKEKEVKKPSPAQEYASYIERTKKQQGK